jgi:hypothetical protein
MAYEVRAAVPSEAAGILQLVKADFTRIGFPAPADITQEEIESLASAIERGGPTKRLVAVGSKGLEAYMKFGPWNAGDENQFVEHQVQAHLNRLRRFGGQTGLFTLAVHGDEPNGYSGPAVDALIEATDIFTVARGQTLNVPVAGIDYPQMRGFTDFLTHHGVEPTGRMGVLAVANVAATARAELWSKTHPN